MEMTIRWLWRSRTVSEYQIYKHFRHALFLFSKEGKSGLANVHKNVTVIGRSGTRKYSIWMIVEVLKQDISWNSKLEVPTVWVVGIAKILAFSWHKLNEVMRSSIMMLRSPLNSHEWQRQNISSQYQHRIKQTSEENKDENSISGL